MFQVGKKYRRGGAEYTCIFADSTGGLLEYAAFDGPNRTWKRSIHFQHYTEVKPKVKVKKFIVVEKYEGRYGFVSFSDFPSKYASEHKVAILEREFEFEEGEGL